MKKTKKLDVSNIDLVSFEGFYQSIWSPEFEISEYEFANEVEEGKDFTCDNDGYEKQFARNTPSSGNAGSSSMFARILNYHL